MKHSTPVRATKNPSQNPSKTACRGMLAPENGVTVYPTLSPEMFGIKPTCSAALKLRDFTRS